MTDSLYNILINVVGTSGFLLNVIAFIVMTAKPPRDVDQFLLLNKLGRIPDAVLCLLAGPLTAVKLIYPVFGIACSNVPRLLNSPMTCNVLVQFIALSIQYVVMFIVLTFLARYNLLIREKVISYRTKLERIVHLIIWVIMPIITIGLCGDYPLSEDKWVEYYKEVAFSVCYSSFLVLEYYQHLALQ
uniref:G_PROTEIN_RECEP_F1_2 domain-containing protein n=1 Tax=Rhabditophanes sp. KR3021 TaxID=114890 RepID=A0AC35U2S0_9BILA